MPLISSRQAQVDLPLPSAHQEGSSYLNLLFRTSVAWGYGAGPG